MGLLKRGLLLYDNMSEPEPQQKDLTPQSKQLKEEWK